MSSTGHLTIVEGLLGLKVDDPGVTAFTAIIQVGAILAVIIYFRSDIGRLASAWLRGLVNGQAREAPTTGSLGMSTRLAFFSPFRLWLPPGRTRRSRKPP